MRRDNALEPSATMPARILPEILSRASPLILPIIFCLFTGESALAAGDAKELDEEFLRSYMAGEYELIGRRPDSTITYTGHITLREENGVLHVTRMIGGETNKCAARFDTVAGADRIPVLRMHFRFEGKEYDASYRWQSDPDNYPRFTGYVYFADTKSPGIEALFPIHK